MPRWLWQKLCHTLLHCSSPTGILTAVSSYPNTNKKPDSLLTSSEKKDWSAQLAGDLEFFLETLCEHFLRRSPGWCHEINPAGFGKVQSRGWMGSRLWPALLHRCNRGIDLLLPFQISLGLSTRIFAQLFVSASPRGQNLLVCY